MNEALQYVGMSQIKKFLPAGEEIKMGEDFLIVDIREGDAGTFIDNPFRVDAFLAIFCQKGGFEIEINLRKFKIQDSTLLIGIPGYIIKVGEMSKGHSIPGRLVAMAISKRFITEIKFDFSKLFESRLMFFYDPRIMLGHEEMAFCSNYFQLLKSILSSRIPDKRPAVGSLVESLMNVLAGLVDDHHIHSEEIETSHSTQTRLNILFEKFMSLVSEYHTSERGMAFYANRLGMTPKYLSKLIKQVSGRSAPDWIDSFVVNEAKSMLKYTDDSIKEIVYKLNFVNASVFYKFFKAQTGMTPSEYRNQIP